MNRQEVDIRQRINSLVEAVQADRARSYEFFGYIWTMMCVRRGLMRVVSETTTANEIQLVVEEVRTGHHRLVARPLELDVEIETLAVQALTRILRSTRRAQ